jgi:hypothetical protein
MEAEKQKLLNSTMHNLSQENSNNNNNDEAFSLAKNSSHGADLTNTGDSNRIGTNTVSGVKQSESIKKSESCNRKDTVQQPSFKRFKTYITQYEKSAKEDEETGANEDMNNSLSLNNSHHNHGHQYQNHLKSLPNPIYFASSVIENQFKALPYLLMNSIKNEPKVNLVTSASNLSTTTTVTDTSDNKLLGLANIALEREESP